MPLAKVVVEFTGNTGQAKDVYTNTMYFDSGGAPGDPISSAEATDLAAKVALNYTNTVDTYISAAVSRTIAPTVSVYQGWGTGPAGNPPYAGGSPIVVYSMSNFQAAAAGVSLPEEVAAVLTFHADLTGVLERVPFAPEGPAGDHKPRARRRGRLFIGPLNATAIETAPTSSVCRFTPTFRDAVAQLGVGLTTNSFGPASAYNLSVFSKTDGLARPVIAGWVDNAPDTQRRRGWAPGAKTAWSAAA